jgi:hypothetical protein
MLNEEEIKGLKEILYIDSLEDHIEKRKDLFNKIDINNTGKLILSEIDLGIKNILNLKEINKIKKIISKAFNSI